MAGPALTLALTLLGPAGSTAAAGPPPPVVNGSVEPGFPTVVSLGADILDERLSLCTGNLITTRIVLTAAHCTDFIPTALLQAGGRAYVGEDIWGAEHALLLEDRVVHPEYVELDNSVGEIGEYDISVVILAEDAPLRPMWLRTEPLTEDLLGTDLLSIGFGLDEHDVSGVKRSATLTFDVLDEQFIVSNSMNNPNGANICSGDSGGPQIAEVDGRWEQWAVHSWGDTGCTQRSGSQRVDIALDWVLDQVELVHGTRDLCKANGWAGDGTCDEICESQGAIDPDCIEPVVLAADFEAEPLDKSGCSTGAPSHGRGLALVALLLPLAVRGRRCHA